MDEEILSNTHCPICLDTYQSPIRMLLCGHNYCESCLINLPMTSHQKISCPKCRNLMQLGSEGFSILPRNHDLENIIENFKKIAKKKTQHPFPTSSLSGNALIPIRGNVTLPMNNVYCQEALQALPSTNINEKIFKKVFAMINKAICQIEIGQHEEAAVTNMEIVSLVEYKATANEMNSIKDKVFDKLINLCEKFIEFNNIDFTFSLVSCIICLTKNVYKDQEQLIQFKRIGALMEHLAIEMNKQNALEQIKQLYCLFDEIFDLMKVLDTVDLKFKCKKIVWVLKYHGLCCNFAEHYSKSELIHNNAIVLMEMVFGSEAKQHRLLGYCYYNLGGSYHKSNQLTKAKIYYHKAIDVFNQATDLPDENKKQKLISLSSKNLQMIDKD